MTNLITMTFTQKSIKWTAVYSECKRYRYSLTRETNNSKLKLLFILLNPSIATETKNDPTISRCQKRTQELGYTAFRVCNLFAFRTKDPLIMKGSIDPIGPENNYIINESLYWSNKIICAWGSDGKYLERGDEVRKIIKKNGSKAFHLGLTKSNQPKHPLYITYSQKILKWI